MKSSARQFPQNAREALADRRLQAVLEKFTDGFPVKRAAAISRLDEFDDLRDAARDIKNHVLANLDTYLIRFEERVVESGGLVHWCRDDAEACQTILGICKAVNARTVTKSKSMIGEEIAINDYWRRAVLSPWKPIWENTSFSYATSRPATLLLLPFICRKNRWPKPLLKSTQTETQSAHSMIPVSCWMRHALSCVRSFSAPTWA